MKRIILNIKPTIKISITTFLFIFLCLLKTRGQEANSGSPSQLKLGDKVPTYEFNGLINYPSSKLQLGDFNGKVVLLDFWTFGCRSCIESWPKLVELQQNFKNDLVIISVNTENTKKEVQEFVEKREKILGIKMNFIMSNGDKNLDVLFPHLTVPYLVWIDQEGTVKAFTGPIELNSDVIKSMIEKKTVQLETQTDDFITPNWLIPLFVDGNGGTDAEGGKIKFVTTITQYSPRYRPAVDIGLYQGRAFGAIVNYSLRDMFAVLYGKEGFGTDEQTFRRKLLPYSQMEFRNLDTTRLFFIVNGIAKRENLMTLHSIVSKEISIEDLKERMIRALNTEFGLTSHWEKQTKKSIILSRTKHSLNEYKSGENRYLCSEIAIDVNGLAVSEFLDMLSYGTQKYNTQKGTYPILDETGFTGKLGAIKFEVNVEDIFKVNKELDKHGMKFSIEDRQIDVLVFSPISDVNNQP